MDSVVFFNGLYKAFNYFNIGDIGDGLLFLSLASGWDILETGKDSRSDGELQRTSWARLGRHQRWLMSCVGWFMLVHIHSFTGELIGNLNMAVDKEFLCSKNLWFPSQPYQRVDCRLLIPRVPLGCITGRAKYLGTIVSYWWESRSPNPNPTLFCNKDFASNNGLHHCKWPT